VPLVDDTDDRCVGWRLAGVERKCSLPPLYEENLLAHAGTNRVKRHQCSPDRLTGGIDRLEQEKSDTGKVDVLERRDDVADDAGELHGLILHLDGVDDPHDGGVYRAVLEA
jgi:hypothetical protein